MNLIDRTLFRVSANIGGTRVEAYLHQDNLAPSEFTVVERTGAGNNDFVIHGFDTLAEAQPVYDAAAARVKEQIRALLAN